MGKLIRVVGDASPGGHADGFFSRVGGAGFQFATTAMLFMDSAQRVRCANDAAAGLFKTDNKVEFPRIPQSVT